MFYKGNGEQCSICFRNYTEHAGVCLDCLVMLEKSDYSRVEPIPRVLWSGVDTRAATGIPRWKRQHYGVSESSGYFGVSEISAYRSNSREASKSYYSLLPNVGKCCRPMYQVKGGRCGVYSWRTVQDTCLGPEEKMQKASSTCIGWCINASWSK